MPSLTKANRAKARVCFTVLVVALTMQRAFEQLGLPNTPEDLPAVKECTVMIDEILNGIPDRDRQSVIDRIQRTRILLYDKTKSADSSDALIAFMNVLVGPTFVSRLGTRFDYLRQTLRKNMPMVVTATNPDMIKVAKLEGTFKEAIFRI